MAKNIFIARHGLTQWNLEGKVQGQSDIPLLEGGIKQAYALAEKIKTEQIPISKILTSPLQRAKKTAQIVSSIMRQKSTMSSKLFGNTQKYG